MYLAHVGVLGAGPWGLSLAAAAARSGTKTRIQSRRDLSSVLPDGVEQVADMRELAQKSRLLVLAVPSGVVERVARELGAYLDGRHLLVHGIRGLAGDALEPISRVLRRETPSRRVGALGGPALANELRDGKPCALVCGSRYPEVNAALVATFGSPSLRVYETGDLVGLEWASALVGCLAIGVGYAHAVGMNAGLVATFISRAVEEASRIAAAAGGNERTLLGLAGYGDLLASIAQDERPEVIVGRAMGRGKTMEQAVDEAKLRVEAIELIPRIAQWAKAHGVRSPIFQGLSSGMLHGRTAEDLVRELMAQPPQKLS
ncbi:NAD(P)-binding domain-containing protein [Pendulispora albinea]|uniref:Glycerol-3-phosphate dehydrogenase n=1 Tax=Pendulispora albinea TaxID=2741071 RepID=A0ABZ2LTH7_9BACT